jgi:hypothetical protein
VAPGGEAVGQSAEVCRVSPGGVGVGMGGIKSDEVFAVVVNGAHNEQRSSGDYAAVRE